MNQLCSSQFLHRASRAGRAAGFTLVEVMISVALALLLMYGVSQVFKLSGDAVGANQAVAAIVRDQRAAAPVFAEDFRNCAPDSPLFLISSRISYRGPNQPAYFPSGFHNADDQRNASNPDPTFVDNPNQPTQTNPPLLALAGVTDRVPRMDRLSFFSRGLFRRQSLPDVVTATSNALTSGEAYIWYGHTALPDIKGGSSTPPPPQIPEMQYAADRILGRVAILLNDSANPSTDGPLVGQKFSGSPLWPLDLGASAYGYYDATKNNEVVCSDVARTSIDLFRSDANAVFSASQSQVSGPYNWYRGMDDLGAAGGVMRFWCTPTVTRPVTPRVLSRSVPYFMGHCSQFIVEYAGDYLNQVTDPTKANYGHLVNGPQKINPSQDTYDPTKVDVAQLVYVNPGAAGDGSTIHGTTDGQIDFLIDHSADTATNKTGVRRIRWYGLPRDVNGDGRIDINDVVPLADVLDDEGLTVNGNAPMAPWEKERPYPHLIDEQGKDYATLKNDAAPNFRYTCAWHNDAPAMIRILVKIDDASGKLQDGQWYQFILTR